jgi:sarcosine oxidase, subunit alpha
MTQPCRLAAGGRVDRTRALSFRFNGKHYQGYAGDTLASALLANGIHFVARSFKYHRPRGIMSAGVEEPNALVQLETAERTEANLRATQIELYDGLCATSVNAWPSLRYDYRALSGVFSPLLVAGFYYKTFIHPKFLWERLYEPALRRMAGMGRAPQMSDPDFYDRLNLHCDVLIAGGGPAGIAAAFAAGCAGAHVVLADEQNEFGGRLLSTHDTIDGRPASEWIASALADLAAMPNVVLLRRTTIFGYYDNNYLTLVERRTDHLGPTAKRELSRQRLWHIRAKEVVLTTGAHERPLVFNGNDRPGIFLASAAETYVNRYAVRPGTRAVVFTNNDSAYHAALALVEAGVEVAAIVDVRSRSNGETPEEARRCGIAVLDRHVIVATKGRYRIAAVDVMQREGSGVAGHRRRIECDVVAMSGGWSPIVHLFSQSQGKLRFEDRIAAFVPQDGNLGRRSAGAARGSFALKDCLSEGFAAGAAAAVEAGFEERPPWPLPSVASPAEGPLEPLWLVPSDRALGRRVKQFVDFQNDVTANDIHLSVREGLDAIEHAKRYTTAGMGTDQGKIGNVAALALVSKATGRKISEAGTTTFRPPYSPVTFGAIAGRERGALYVPTQITPMHVWHVAAGAVFEDVGQWKRPRYYPVGSEDMDAAVRRECFAVRDSLGVQDVTTLGKIEAHGRDVAKFLDLIYTSLFSNLGTNRCRYGLMCGEDGMVVDDGVTTRLAEEHFYLTTTTGGAARVLERLEEWLQTEWPDLQVYLTSVTDQWSAAVVAGPCAREVMHELAPELAIDDVSFPFLSMREARVAGIAARVFRISFSGELSYEINVPARFGLALWTAIMERGAKYGITPYGTETMHLLRAEKGFIIIGQETDGTTTPADLGMDWMVSKKKKDFIGKRSLSRPDTMRPDRKQLVGLLMDDPAVVLPEGTQLTPGVSDKPAGGSITGRGSMIGHVTSSYWSPALKRGFALALVQQGRDRIGSNITAELETGRIPVSVVSTQMFDKEGVRQHG